MIAADKSKVAHFEYTSLCPDGKLFVTTAFDGGKERLGRLSVEISADLKKAINIF